jgi:hypothetical protein
MKESVEGVAEMLAVGLGLPQDAFTSHGKYGTHLLAPTATNLERYGKLGSGACPARYAGIVLTLSHSLGWVRHPEASQGRLLTIVRQLPQRFGLPYVR